MIVELIPGEMVTLKTAYDEVFVIQMADISKIVMEEGAIPAPKKDKPTPPTSTSVKLEKWYFHLELGTGVGGRTVEFGQWVKITSALRVIETILQGELAYTFPSAINRRQSELLSTHTVSVLRSA